MTQWPRRWCGEPAALSRRLSSGSEPSSCGACAKHEPATSKLADGRGTGLVGVVVRFTYSPHMSLPSWLPRGSLAGRSGSIGVVLACALGLGGCSGAEPAAPQVSGALTSPQSSPSVARSVGTGSSAVSHPIAAEPDSPRAASEQVAAICTPGPTTINGVEVNQHCGPASGQFTYEGKTVRVAPGQCQVVAGAWVINLGASVVGALPDTALRAQIRYLGIVAAQSSKSRASGSDFSAVAPSEVIVAFTGAGFADSIQSGQAAVTFAADGRSGTFSGPTHGGLTVSGKFDCGR